MNSLFAQLLPAILILGFSYQSSAQCVSNESNVVSFSYNGANYEIVKENLNWINASSCAVSRGGFLVEINSQGEQDALFSNVNSAGISASNTVAPDGGGASYLWLGANDLLTEGAWIWDGDNTGSSSQFWQGTTSGSAVGGLYNNWGNEPDDFNGQDALGLAFTNWPLGIAGQWNDVDETNTLYYIIEYPNTIGLINKTLQPEIKMYPNPGLEIVVIEFSEELQSSETRVNIFDTSGKLIDRIFTVENTVFLNTSRWNDGIYFVNIENDNGVSETQKLMLSSK